MRNVKEEVERIKNSAKNIGSVYRDTGIQVGKAYAEAGIQTGKLFRDLYDGGGKEDDSEEK